jgi:divalent metal cation (Fe/Co/Zn/Cd) transporter
MQWWLWVLIWFVLILALLGTLVLFGWRLVRKGMAVLDELQLLGDKVEALQRNVDQLTDEVPRNAILDGYPAVAARHDREKIVRMRRRELRRERRMARGRLITAPNAWKGRTDAR